MPRASIFQRQGRVTGGAYRRSSGMADAIDSDYEDTGCEESATCVTCVLPVCKHDDPAWYIQHRTWRADVTRVAAIATYRTVRVAAEATGIPESTLHKARARVLAGEPMPFAQEVKR